MYLKGAQIDPKNILTEWNGREGKFVRTFGINDTRNSNEWRSTWDGILNNIKKSIGRPGIEFEKCTDAGCGLDHVEAESLEENYQKQKPFEVTNMIDYVVDEDTHTVDVIHEVHDDRFWDDLNSGKVKFVSPMIWPNNGGATSNGTGRADLPIVDTWDYEWVHMAFLEKNPAFGPNAGVRTMCEGKNCGVQLLSANSDATADPSTTTLTPLKEVPLLVKHKDNLHLVSLSSSVQKIIKNKKDSGIKIDDSILSISHSECKEFTSLKSSFKTCTCEKSNKMPDTEQQLVELKSKFKAQTDEKKDLEAKLKAQEDKDEKSQQAKKARYAKMFASTSNEDEEDKMVAILKATENKEDLKAAMDEYENHKNAKKAQSEDPEKKELMKANKAMMATLSEPMVAGLVALRKGKLSESDLTNYEVSLKAKSFGDIQIEYENEKYLMAKSNSLSASIDSGLAFPDENTNHSLSAKSIDDILEVAN